MNFSPIPNTYDQSLFASVKQANDMGRVALAHDYFGSPESRRQNLGMSQAFSNRARSLGWEPSSGATRGTPRLKPKKRLSRLGWISPGSQSSRCDHWPHSQAKTTHGGLHLHYNLEDTHKTRFTLNSSPKPPDESHSLSSGQC